MAMQYGNRGACAALYGIDKRFMIIYDTTNPYYAMVNRPIFPFTIVSFYLLFCIWLGPRIMRNRQPFHLNKFICIYDFLLAVGNLYVYIAATNHFFGQGWELQCSPNMRRRLELLAEKTYALDRYVSCCYILKFVELLDTIFFVLAKKTTHVSFLHLFHHTITPVLLWYIVVYDCAATYWMFVLMTNSFVHILMYTYYGLVAIGYKRITRQKKILTSLQIVQFLAQMLYLLFVYASGCTNDSSSTTGGWIIIFIVCVLFVNFYRENFMKKSK